MLKASSFLLSYNPVVPRAYLADNFEECDLTKVHSLSMGNVEREVPKVNSEPF